MPDPTLYDKNTCFSPNDKLVDPNNNNWTHVFENAKNSVVKVTDSNPYSNPEISTGFIYDNDGHIVTNYHVVNNANSINVTFADGNSYPVQITGTDPYSDLAVVQPSAATLKKEQMKPLPIRNSSALQVGENVGAIGYPFEQLSFSVEGLEPNLSSISDPFITAINGSPIKNSSDFYNYIHNKSVGDRVVLTTMHDGVTRNFTVTLGEMPSPL